jgi:hypothetical protein
VTASSALRINDIAVLTPGECDRVRDTIMALRPRWTRRNPWVPFYTLGAASYLDAAAGPAAYQQMAAEYNPLLIEHFSWLYTRVAGALGEHLGAPAACAENLAPPGFHIYLSSKVFEKPIASIHCDSQYRLHDWSGQEADLDNPISFTLSITLPKNGGGLNNWDVRYEEIMARAGDDLAQLIHGRNLEYHAYEKGQMVVHSGHLLHQAAPGKDVQPDDERLTLQGHGILARGVWRLYW